MSGGQVGHEAVFGHGGQILYVAPAARRQQVSGASGHHVGVDIDRIDRVGHGHAVAGREDVAYVARVALGAVAHEYLVLRHGYAAAAVVVLGYQRRQELVSLLGPIAVERLRPGLVVDTPVQGLDHRRTERAGHVADAKT